MTTGEAIHLVRRTLGVSQAEMGAALGVTSHCVMEWEKGRIIPTLGRLALFHERYGYHPLLLALLSEGVDLGRHQALLLPFQKKAG